VLEVRRDVDRSTIADAAFSMSTMLGMPYSSIAMRSTSLLCLRVSRSGRHASTIVAPRMLILLTNDDGITAPGILAMYHALTELGEVHVVAPGNRAERHRPRHHHDQHAAADQSRDDGLRASSARPSTGGRRIV